MFDQDWLIPLKTAWQSLAQLSLERILWALLIAVAGLLSARLVDKFVTKLLYGWTQLTETKLDDLIIEQLHRPIRRSVVLIGFYVAILVSGLPENVASFLAHLLQTLFVLICLFAAMPLASIVFRWMSRHETRFEAVQPASLPLFSIGSKVALVGAAVYLGMLAWEINVAAWVASAGIMGLAVGFAARDTLANLFAGVSILADAPYKIGDYIVLNPGNQRGMVTQIGLRSTRILTRDDIEITIPNAAIANSTLVNESGGPAIHQRVRLRVSVAYGSDVDQVRDLLLAVAEEEPLVRPEPAPRVRFRQFGDSGLIFELLCWIAEAELRGRAIDALHTRAYKILGDAGIEIPFPQQDINIRQAP
ncbi:MAG: mechanosensitive ion channel family protein [Candidatus Aminicenantes bacterium]|nr:mechanosensitive ion channel family protein [Candidatus Aminicenantes bacterium]